MAAACELASILTATYDDFLTNLVNAIGKMWAASGPSASSAASANYDLPKRRVLLRFLLELMLAGVVTEDAKRELPALSRAKDELHGFALGLFMWNETCDRILGDFGGVVPPQLELNVEEKPYAVLASVMQKQGLSLTGCESATQKGQEKLAGREWKYTRTCYLGTEKHRKEMLAKISEVGGVFLYPSALLRS